METFFGNEIVAGTRRLALMNLFLHNIGDIESDNFISPADASIAASPTTYNYVLANPPFGKKSSQTFTNDEGEQEKDDLTYNCFWQKAHRSRYNESRGKPFTRMRGLCARTAPTLSIRTKLTVLKKVP